MVGQLGIKATHNEANDRLREKARDLAIKLEAYFTDA
jgi:hypothetical protein